MVKGNLRVSYNNPRPHPSMTTTVPITYNTGPIRKMNTIEYIRSVSEYSVRNNNKGKISTPLVLGFTNGTDTNVSNVYGLDSKLEWFRPTSKKLSKRPDGKTFSKSRDVKNPFAVLYQSLTTKVRNSRV